MKYLLLLTFVTLVSGREIYDPLDNRDHRIVGGTETKRHEFPSMLNEGVHSCGATLIHPQWALTACHCINFNQVVGGDHNIRLTEQTEVRVSVEQNICHPSYMSPQRYSNDIALLKLSQPFTLNEYIQLAPLPPPHFEPTGNSVVVGWGTTEFGGVSNVLRKVKVPLVSPTDCHKAYPGQIDDSMICAGIADKDSCQGDSGGPMFCDYNGQNVHCGIVSWGRGCGLDGYPGVYGRTSRFLNWINQTITNNT